MYTIQQLIKKLSKFPPEMPVMVDGYEGGYHNVKPELLFTKEVVYEPSYDYNGDYVTQEDSSDKTSQVHKVLVISRKKRGMHY